ncbi:DNA-binding response regulator [Flavobacterium sp. XS2P14]|uniref:response regulator transcription factor n=1 Tax=Flavobacterium sp. XS2P14 TaxID=3401735 RepID=UPI003AAF924E
MNKKTIVIVEDNPENASYIQTILTKESFAVLTGVATYEQALAAINELQPILVLIDIELNKKKDGVDIGNYLLELGTTPFIYVTSCTDPENIERVKATRPHGFLVKPFKPIDLTTTVAIVISNFKYRNIETTSKNFISSNDHIPFKLQQVITYINQNLDKKIEVEQLVALTNWEQRNFRRIFMKYLLVSPYQYVIALKIERSLSLLKNLDIPINQVALELGFKNYSNFFVAFKKIRNETPEDYRNKRFFE